MQRSLKLAVLVSAIGALFVSAPAFALDAYSTTHLNLRSGPGTQYPVVGVLDKELQSTVTGCIADWSWCAVDAKGVNGWVSSQYLLMAEGGKVGPDIGIPVVGAEAFVAVAAVPALGEFVGWNGHVDAIVPEPAVLEYISATPVPPSAVTGEVVVGAVLPVAVALVAVPGSAYGYAMVNGVKVLADINARTIAYIQR
jgi:uncharacterized protein YraI